MSKNQTNYDEIQDKHLDTMIKLAFEYKDGLETQNNAVEEDNMPVIDTARKEAVWEKAMEKYTKMEAAEKKKNRIVQFRRSIPRIIQVAACLVLVMGIATPFAIANVEAIRVKVMELLIDIQEDHTELSFFENDNKAFYVPANWSGLYYPSDIPDEFVVAEMSEIYCDVTYINAAGAKIYYSEYQPDDLVDINSENATLSHAVINGENAFVIERENLVIVTWASEERFFVVEAETTKEEALVIAESVRRISLEN